VEGSYEKKGYFQLVDSGHPSKGFRLPRHLVPTSYELNLAPDLEGREQSPGSVSIYLKFDGFGLGRYDGKRIVLHAKNIHIDEASVT